MRKSAPTVSTTGLNHFNLRAPRELLDELREFYCINRPEVEATLVRCKRPYRGTET